MIPRLLAPRLRALLDRFPAVALIGPRQAGKTTLTRALADGIGERAVYLNLEFPSDRAKLSDAELYPSTHENRLVILDVIHRTPGIFETLRGIIDQRRRKGIRTGSSCSSARHRSNCSGSRLKVWPAGLPTLN